MRFHPNRRGSRALLAGVLAAAALLTACNAKPSAASGPVRFAVFNWDGARITTQILIAITKQYPELGVDDVATIDLQTTAGWVALGEGDADVLTEVAWPNQKPLYQKNKESTELLSKTYGPVPQGWFVPSYVVKQGGAAPDLTSVQQLGKYKSAFDGTLYDGPQGWITTEWNTARLKAYGLGGYEHVNASEAAYLAQVKKSIAAKKPIVFYLWHPHWAFAKFDLTQLREAKPYQQGCFDKADAGPCAMPGQKAYVAARKDLKEKAPKFNAFLKEFELHVPELEKMLAKTSQANKPVKRVAKEWVSSHKPQIKSWINESGKS